MATIPINIQFRCNLTGNNRVAWLHLLERLWNVSLTDRKDDFKWNLTSTGLFSNKSLYADLLNENNPSLRTCLWKIKIPLKIKIFLWFLRRCVLLTKDNLAKRQWTGCKKCVFCDMFEFVEHLFIPADLLEIFGD